MLFRDCCFVFFAILLALQSPDVVIGQGPPTQEQPAEATDPPPEEAPGILRPVESHLETIDVPATLKQLEQNLVDLESEPGKTSTSENFSKRNDLINLYGQEYVDKEIQWYEPALPDWAPGDSIDFKWLDLLVRGRPNPDGQDYSEWLGLAKVYAEKGESCWQGVLKHIETERTWGNVGSDEWKVLSRDLNTCFQNDLATMAGDFSQAVVPGFAGPFALFDLTGLEQSTSLRVLLDSWNRAMGYLVAKNEGGQRVRPTVVALSESIKILETELPAALALLANLESAGLAWATQGAVGLLEAKIHELELWKKQRPDRVSTAGENALDQRMAKARAEFKQLQKSVSVKRELSLAREEMDQMRRLLADQQAHEIAMLKSHSVGDVLARLQTAVILPLVILRQLVELRDTAVDHAQLRQDELGAYLKKAGDSLSVRFDIEATDEQKEECLKILQETWPEIKRLVVHSAVLRQSFLDGRQALAVAFFSFATAIERSHPRAALDTASFALLSSRIEKTIKAWDEAVALNNSSFRTSEPVHSAGLQGDADGLLGAVREAARDSYEGSVHVKRAAIIDSYKCPPCEPKPVAVSMSDIEEWHRNSRTNETGGRVTVYGHRLKLGGKFSLGKNSKKDAKSEDIVKTVIFVASQIELVAGFAVDLCESCTLVVITQVLKGPKTPIRFVHRGESSTVAIFAANWRLAPDFVTSVGKGKVLFWPSKSHYASQAWLDFPGGIDNLRKLLVDHWSNVAEALLQRWVRAPESVNEEKQSALLDVVSLSQPDMYRDDYARHERLEKKIEDEKNKWLGTSVQILDDPVSGRQIPFLVELSAGGKVAVRNLPDRVLVHPVGSAIAGLTRLDSENYRISFNLSLAVSDFARRRLSTLARERFRATSTPSWNDNFKLVLPALEQLGFYPLSQEKDVTLSPGTEKSDGVEREAWTLEVSGKWDFSDHVQRFLVRLLEPESSLEPELVLEVREKDPDTDGLRSVGSYRVRVSFGQLAGLRKSIGWEPGVIKNSSSEQILLRNIFAFDRSGVASIAGKRLDSGKPLQVPKQYRLKEDMDFEAIVTFEGLDGSELFSRAFDLADGPIVKLYRVAAGAYLRETRFPDSSLLQDGTPAVWERYLGSTLDLRESRVEFRHRPESGGESTLYQEMMMSEFCSLGVVSGARRELFLPLDTIKSPELWIVAVPAGYAGAGDPLAAKIELPVNLAGKRTIVSRSDLELALMEYIDGLPREEPPPPVAPPVTVLPTPAGR